jgi:flagellar hook-associated protein 2
MATITSAGIGSGLDVNNIVTELVAAERQPFDEKYAANLAENTSKITAMGKLKSALSTLEDALFDLKLPTTFSQRTATSDAEAFSVTAGSASSPGSFEVSIDRLAQSHKIASEAFESGSFVGAGQMTISVGSGSFSITVGEEDTLEDIKDSINSNSVNDGHITANLINGDDGQYIVLTARDTGEDYPIEIEVTDDDGNSYDDSGLSRLAFDSSKTTLAETFTAGEVLGSNGDITFSDGVDTATISITDTDTIETIVSNINAAGLELTASLEDDGSGNLYLVLDSSNEYPNNQASISIDSDDDGDTADNLGISKLAHTYAVDNFTVVSEAIDAQITIDGSITVTSSSNTIENAVQGITIEATEVHEAGESDVVTVELDTEGTKEKVEQFVADYNALIGVVNDLTKVNSEEVEDEELEFEAGILVSESSVRTMMSQFRRVIGEAVDVGSGVNLSLSVLGITTTKEGTLEIDTAQLDSQIDSNFDYFSELFSGDNGIARSLYDRVGEYENTGGVIDEKIQTFNDNIDRMEDDKTQFEQRMTSYEARLYAQFLAMDLQVAELQATGSYLTQQLSALSNSKKDN